MATKIITVGGNVVTTTSGGTTYALSISSNLEVAAQAISVSGLDSSATELHYVSDSVAIPSNAVKIEGGIYIRGTADSSYGSSCGLVFLGDFFTGVAAVSSASATDPCSSLFVTFSAVKFDTTWFVNVVSNSNSETTYSGSVSSPTVLLTASGGSGKASPVAHTIALTGNGYITYVTQ
jgi:hypothetical protein